MKKRSIAMFLTIAFILSHLCACELQPEAGNRESVQGTDTEVDSDSDNKNPITPPQENTDVVVSEMYSLEGNVSIPDGSEFQYSYHVPQIEDDTPDAASINEEISQLYGITVESNMEYINNGESPWCNIIGYESYRCGDILSLVLRCSFYYEYYEEYSTYTYDMAKGEKLTNDDILSMKGVSEDAYLHALRRAAVKCYDDWYFPIWKDFHSANAPWAYQERRIFTLSEKNITPDLPLYLGDDGAMHTIVPIGCHSGVDWLYKPLTPDFEDDTVDIVTDTSLDFLTATCRGNTLTLCFHETAEGSRMLEENPYLYVPYEEEVTVNGLYGDYSRIFCTTTGEVDMPYVFLLTCEGRVEYVDVTACLYGYFCAGGPLFGVEDVKDFTTDIDENGYQWVYAITGNGEKIDLIECIMTAQRDMADCFTDGWGCTRTVSMDDGESIEEYAYVEFTGDGSFHMSFYQSQLDYNIETDGYLTYLGMTEEGAVYAYHLWGEYSNGPGMNGTAAFETWQNDDGLVLDITELGGTPFIGNQTGDTTALGRTLG